MKLQELFEAVDPKLIALFSKHNLKPNRAGSAVDDFNFTASIGTEFEDAGYKLNYNSKTQKFDVQNSQKIAKAADDAETNRKVQNITAGRRQGFKPHRKMM